MISTIINVNSPDGATYSQTVYVPKYSPRHAWFLRLLEVNVLRSEHLIYHKNHKEPLIYGVFRKKIKELRFIRGVVGVSTRASRCLRIVRDGITNVLLTRISGMPSLTNLNASCNLPSPHTPLFAFFL